MGRALPTVLLHAPIDSLNKAVSQVFWLRYGSAVIAAAAGILLGKACAGFGPAGIYLPIVLAVVFSAWYGGVGPALLCQLCGLVFAFSYVARPGPFAPVTTTDIYGLVLFLVIGKLTLFLTANVRWNMDLRRSEQGLKLVAAATNDCIWEWDLQTGLVKRSGNLSGVFGKAAGEMRPDIEWWREQVHPDDRETTWASLERAITNKQEHWEAEYRLRHQDGSFVLVADRGRLVRDSAGRVQRIIGGMSDVTAHRRAEERLAFDALHDELTGLPNRQYFRQRLEQALTATSGDNVTAVLFLDLDRFKVINDSLGHPAGDRVLRALARRIEMSLHPGEFAARFGGDEFTVLLEGIGGATDAVAVADRLLKSLAFAFDFETHSFVVNASIGIAVSDKSIFSEEILRYADMAMYRAKARGRARYEVFESQLEAGAMNALRLESELRKALADGDFRLYYQPIVSLSNGRLVGFEALLRWQHPTRGVLLPAEFLSSAEESGLIDDLGAWVMSTACRHFCAWRSTIPAAQDIRMSVNLASRQFSHPNLVDRVREILQDNALPGCSLILELTENMILENNAFAAARLDALREMGVRIAIDDFGKGHSSFGRLQDLPIGILKIDGAFVDRISDGKPEIVDAIIGLANQLKLEVTAERVESREEFEHLRRAQCTTAQGLYFSDALDDQSAADLLRSNRDWNDNPRAAAQSRT